jgi:UTP--glucose-1-phosphate uridylyltransferase
VVALSEFPNEEISSYGCVDPEVVSDELVRVRGIVEKPEPAEAPSNLAVMGRYVFTPEIFDALDQVRPGVGGEIQLTDAIALLLESQTVYGYVFSEGRYDIGKKLDYLRATVELALDREDLGPEFRSFLRELVQKRGLE